MMNVIILLLFFAHLQVDVDMLYYLHRYRKAFAFHFLMAVRQIIQ